MNTQDKILQVAKQLVAQKGAKSVTVTEVAERIGVTHQAAYKHFKSKKQLMEQLALLWLDEILLPVITFEGNSVHDWLWLLVSCKKRAYTEDREMFELYTHYISTNLALEDQHNQHLAQLLCDFSSENETEDYQALIQAFMVFQHPQFANRWDEHFQENFEAVWNLVADKFV
ncbi:TetR/AcrR family transcriptional regulator [Lactococcus protaetiae]|uniref:TetR/AcrR family transcriptional regulator n=1 Tax=Lactococcus protaetiae TaxID=2592653 RepID=A0A514Z6B5_9LACT|nr:TetR/AcrR family transcriptional regulator [Lactococcus protaetiae]QDK70093.1 TetR/AcrR family transcriptional regulator [Lactococcus protaetiae]